MTKLELAFAEAAKLPQSEQEALAEWILQEIASEHAWTEAFAATPDKLGHLAEEALKEHQTGQTRHLDPDRL